MSKATVEEMLERLRQSGAPEPPPGLLQRILDSRAAGVRVVLPEDRSTVSRRAALLVIAGAAAVVLLISTGGGNRRPVDPDSGYQDIAAGLSLWPLDAMAQEAGPPRPPRYAPARLEVGRAHAGTWTYRTCTVFDEGQPMCLGRLTIMVREAMWRRRSVWLVSRHQAMVRKGSRETILTPLDTAFFERATLRPIYTAMGGKRFRLVRWFIGDTVREELDITGASPRSWRVAAQIPGAPDAPLVLRWTYWEDLAPLLQVLPLERGWRGSVYSVRLVGPDPGKAPFMPLDLRVVGSGRIEVPAGRFDCWKVEVREGQETENVLTLWVSKDRGWLVRADKRGTDGRSETALLAATPPTP
jgi:hypothetical protein